MPAYGKYLTDTFSEAITLIVSIVAPNKLQSMVNLFTFSTASLIIFSTPRNSKVCEPHLLNTNLYEICSSPLSALVQSLINFCQDHYTVCIKYLVTVIHSER